MTAARLGTLDLKAPLRLRRVPLSGPRLGGFPGGGSDRATRRGILKRKIIPTGEIIHEDSLSLRMRFY